MDIKYTKEEKKSIVLTTVICLILFGLLFFIRFFDGKNVEDNFGGGGGGGGEEGIAVSLQNNSAMMANVSSKSTTTIEPISEIIEEQKTEIKEVVEDVNILATKEDIHHTDVVLKKEEKTKETKAIKKETPVKEAPKTTTTAPKVVEKPKIENSTEDVLNNLLNKPGVTSTGGGKSNGTASSGYYGSGSGGSGGGVGGGNGTGNGIGTGSGSGSGSGSGTGGGDGSGVGDGTGYSLAGRSALVKPVPKYLCNEVGIVVVEVYVDPQGNTIDARPGVKGSTNTVKCLLDQAKIAALATKWQPNSKAPAKQVGKIVYNFNLQ